MRGCSARSAVLLIAVAVGCGGGESGSPEPEVCSPPNRVAGGRCLEPGVADDGCAAGSLGLADGSCQPAGVPPGMCGEGFTHDGDVGCDPVLPAQPCTRGQMAVPGETECHVVAPCAAGTWGDIVVDGDTEFVDQSFAGSSDGSMAAPWKTIGDAVGNATDGSLVAIAQGSYVEDVGVSGKTLRVRGVCPERVE